MRWYGLEPAGTILSVFVSWGNEKKKGHKWGTICCVSLYDAELGWCARGGGVTAVSGLQPLSHPLPAFMAHCQGCT